MGIRLLVLIGKICAQGTNMARISLHLQIIYIIMLRCRMTGVPISAMCFAQNLAQE